MWPSQFTCSIGSNNLEIKYQTIKLHYERCKLQSMKSTVGICMVHVLVGDDNVVLTSHVIGNIVIHDQSEQSIQEGEIHLLVGLFEFGFEEHQRLTLRGIPNTMEVVDTLAPLIHQQRRRFSITRLDPVGEQSPLVGLVPQILIQVGIGDLLQGIHIVNRHQMRIQIHELQSHLFEHPLCE